MVTMYTYDDGTGGSGTFLNSSLSIQVLDSFQVCRRLNDMNILGSPFKTFENIYNTLMEVGEKR